MFAKRLAILLGGTVAYALLSAVACAQYPSKPVRFVVPYTPGGGTDLMARALAQRLTENMGQSFVVENRAGAGGNLGMAQVARSLRPPRRTHRQAPDAPVPAPCPSARSDRG